MWGQGGHSREAAAWAAPSAGRGSGVRRGPDFRLLDFQTIPTYLFS